MDKHLNIFYSYEHKYLENNMTRAFIVTLKTLSPEKRNEFLNKLFCSDENYSYNLDFKKSRFAFQGNIDLNEDEFHKIDFKILVSLTGNKFIEDIEQYEDSKKFKKIEVSKKSRPDAWIYYNEAQPSFCFLFECKPVSVLLNARQIISYGKQYYDYRSYKDVERSLIYLTWYDIIEVCSELLKNKKALNNSEIVILYDLIEYLEWNDVIYFIGFDFQSMPVLPEVDLTKYFIMNFGDVPSLPVLNISKESFQINYEAIPSRPLFNFIIT